jgi:hypothetical protein
MDLRDRPTSSGKPGTTSSPRRRSSEIVFEGLAKTEARIDRDAAQGDARRFGRCNTLAEEPGDLGDDVVIVRFVLHAARIALHVHQANRSLACGDNLHGARCAQCVDVVDHVGAGGQYGAHDFRLDRVDRQRQRRSRAGPRSPAAAVKRSRWAGIGTAPGREDSAPKSRMWAPSSSSRRPCAMAASTLPCRPSPEKESSDRLTMPMMSGRSALRTWRPQ